MVKIHFFRKLWVTLSIIGCIFPLCLMSCCKTSEPSLKWIAIKKIQIQKTFDASVLNKYYSGQFTLAWDKKSDCELVSTKDFKINPLVISGKQH